MAKSKSKKWEKITKKYQGRALTEYLMIQYIKVGKYSKLAKECGVAASIVSDNIKKHIEEVKYDKPYLYDMFKDKINESAINNYSGKRFDPGVLETLPSKIGYIEFIDLMNEYNIRNLSVIELIKLAGEHGTRVFEIIKGKEKFISC